MSAVLILLLLLLVGVILFNLARRRALPDVQPQRELHDRRPAGLFDDLSAGAAKEQSTNEAEGRRLVLLARAARGDKGALVEASADACLYRETLDLLVSQAGGRQEEIRALVSYILDDERLRASRALAASVIESCESSPSRRAAARMLHVAALSDDAATYHKAVEVLLRLWQEGRLNDVSAKDMRELIEHEYWVLAPEARRSGEAAVLKRLIANARKQLAASERASASEGPSELAS